MKIWSICGFVNMSFLLQKILLMTIFLCAANVKKLRPFSMSLFSFKLLKFLLKSSIRLLNNHFKNILNIYLKSIQYFMFNNILYKFICMFDNTIFAKKISAKYPHKITSSFQTKSWRLRVIFLWNEAKTYSKIIQNKKLRFFLKEIIFIVE